MGATLERLAPESAYYQAVLGDTHRQLGNADAAVLAYQRGVAIDPSESLAQVGMQWVHAKRGELVRAAAHASRAREGDPPVTPPACSPGAQAG